MSPEKSCDSVGSPAPWVGNCTARPAHPPGSKKPVRNWPRTKGAAPGSKREASMSPFPGYSAWPFYHTDLQAWPPASAGGWKWFLLFLTLTRNYFAEKVLIRIALSDYYGVMSLSFTVWSGLVQNQQSQKARAATAVNSSSFPEPSPKHTQSPRMRGARRWGEPQWSSHPLQVVPVWDSERTQGRPQGSASHGPQELLCMDAPAGSLLRAFSWESRECHALLKTLTQLR